MSLKHIKREVYRSKEEVIKMEGVKTCPKCTGDIFVDWDYGDGELYEYCLQCAYRHYLPVIAEKKQEVAPRGRPRKKRRRRSQE